MKVPLLVGGNSNFLVFRYTGNGSATFDPSITTSAGVSVSWKPDDAPETVTTGTTHNFSYTPSAGSHVCIVRVAGGLGLVTAIDCQVDSVTRITNLKKARCTTYALNSNASLVVDLADLAQNAAFINFNGDYLIYGNTAAIGGVSALFRCENSLITGSLSDFTSATLQTLMVYQCVGITPGPIGHLTAIRDIRIYSMWSDAASVDTVIESMWDARANYTYATPSLQIGGTNPAPTGNYIAPEEGADWHNDGSKWIPLTPNAKAYDLGNDVNEEGFNTWTISKN